MKLLKVYFLLFFCVCSFSQASQTCKTILNLAEVYLGDSVDVQVRFNNSTPVERQYRNLIFIGESTDPFTNKKTLVFSDANTNIYYFEASSVKINQRPTHHYDFSMDRLPHLIKQTEGSCNLCANVSAINQIALDNFLDPINLSVPEIEYSKTADIFSGEASYRLLLNSLYDLMWPEGYVPGTNRNLNQDQLRKIVISFLIRNMNAMTRSLEITDLELGPEYISLPLKITSKHSNSRDDFFEHLKLGEPAVVSGLVVSDQTIISQDSNGQIRQRVLPRLIPMPGLGEDIDETVENKDPAEEFIQSPEFSTVLKRLHQGERPNREFVLDAIRLFVEKPGHAVSAIRFIEDGLLKGHIVVINSWGTIEIHPPSHFGDGLNFVLISKSI